MKLLILSDTHGNYALAVKALEEAGHTDLIIHLGDEIDDARMIEAIAGRPLIKVPGNCDLGVEETRTVLVTCNGTRLLITHGDRYQVKSGLTLLRNKAIAEQVRIVLYGHTHRAAIEEHNGILFVNPGALCAKCTHPSYAIVNLSAGRIAAEILPVTP